MQIIMKLLIFFFKCTCTPRALVSVSTNCIQIRPGSNPGKLLQTKCWLIANRSAGSDRGKARKDFSEASCSFEALLALSWNASAQKDWKSQHKILKVCWIWFSEVFYIRCGGGTKVIYVTYPVFVNFHTQTENCWSFSIIKFGMNFILHRPVSLIW